VGTHRGIRSPAGVPYDAPVRIQFGRRPRRDRRGCNTRVVSLLASVISAAQDVNVKIIDDGRGALGLRDLVVPLGTLIGALIAGIGGVLVGGQIQQRIEKNRGEREDQLDDRRAQRERELEDERQARADHADKRQAIGATRAAIGELQRVMMGIASTAAVGVWWPEEWDPAPHLTPDQVHLLATWLSHFAWADFDSTRQTLDHTASTAHRKRKGGSPTATQRLGLLEDIDYMRMTVTRLREEIERMTVEIGDSSTLTWTSIPGDVAPTIVDDLHTKARLEAEA